MSEFSIELGFDWNSQSALWVSSAVQLQVCLSKSLPDDSSRIASFFGEMAVGDGLSVSIVNITDDDALALEVITGMIIFSRAHRSITGAASPLDVRYFAAAGDLLGSTCAAQDNRPYNVEAAPTWALGEDPVTNQGTFKFSASVIVRDPASDVLRTYAVDPEMEVGAGTGGGEESYS